jgi:hypothetical protein
MLRGLELWKIVIVRVVSRPPVLSRSANQTAVTEATQYAETFVSSA